MGPQRKLMKIWTNKASGTFYPITQVPPSKAKLPNYAWFDYIRPLDKDDIFVWRGKAGGTALKPIKRHAAPLQSLGGTPPPGEEAAAGKEGGTEHAVSD